MVQSRVEEGKSYRRRKKELMGVDEFNADEARKRKERRARFRARSIPVDDETTDDDDDDDDDLSLDEIYNRKLKIAESKGHTIKRTSVVTAYNRITRLHKLMFNTDMVNFKWVRETNKISKFIMSSTVWLSTESKIQQFQSLASILKVLVGFEKQYKIYSNRSIKMRRTKTKIDEKNELTDRERENILRWSTIMKIKTTNAHDAALVGIYTLIPPRRLDFRIMKITSSDDGLDDEYNYLLLNDKGVPKSFIFYNYKTFSKFGKQTINIPKKLATKLKDYILDADLVNNNFLFGKTPDIPYISFSNVVSKVFKKYTNKSISVNLLRHSYITWFLAKPNLSIADRKNISRLMSHSLTTQGTYNRIDL